MKNKTFCYYYKGPKPSKLEDFLIDKLENFIFLKVSSVLLRKLEILINSKKSHNLSLNIAPEDKIEIIIPHKILKDYKLPLIPSYELKSEDILFEDKDILIINKPAGYPSAETLDPRRDHVHAMTERYCKKSLILLHRLDVETSGVLLLAKNKVINKPLQQLFEKKKIKKTYLALSLNKPAKDMWEVQNYLQKEKTKTLKMVESSEGKTKAQTKFKLLEEINGKFLIEAKPLTGQTHQIRVHLAQSGCPIYGDKLYGEEIKGVRCMLHAYSIEFKHPTTSECILIKSNTPSDFNLN